MCSSTTTRTLIISAATISRTAVVAKFTLEHAGGIGAVDGIVAGKGVRVAWPGGWDRG